MLENWQQAPKVKGTDFAPWQFGANILQHIGDQFPDLRTSKVALVGVGTDTDAIRKYLYQMGHPFSKFPIVDIGNLRNPTEESLLPVLRELLESKIIPIVLSGESTILTAQFKAYQDRFKKINLAIVDEKIPYHKDNFAFLSVLRKNKKPKLANVALVGYQSHLCPSESILYYQKKNYDCVRLGIAKSNMEEIEPAVRNVNALYFNLSAVKQADAPGTWENSPSGFTSEEACRVCHYAGMSDKISSIGFYGYCKEKDKRDQTAKLIAQMVWYLLEGIYHRKKDFPVSTDRMTEYIVSFKDHDFDITFWKSNKTGRWWIEIPDKKKKGNHIIPCSYEDYQLACQNEFTGRLLNIMERFA